MQISRIANRHGERKQVMSQFLLKGVKPNWFMMTSGCGSMANWEVLIPKANVAYPTAL